MLHGNRPVEYDQCCTSCTSFDAVHAASRRPHFLQMTACFHAPYKRSNIVFLCVICPELLHSYHNCNVDSFFATDEQFQRGMNVDINRLTNEYFRHSFHLCRQLQCRQLHVDRFHIWHAHIFVMKSYYDSKSDGLCLCMTISLLEVRLEHVFFLDVEKWES